MLLVKILVRSLYQKMNYTIRSATVTDQTLVWEMLSYAAHEASVESVRNQPCLARYASNWGRFGDLGSVAQNNSDQLCLGMAWLRLWLDQDKGFGYIEDTIPELGIAVLPDYRGHGIGTSLLNKILEMAKNQFPAVSLSVRADNSVIRLYERSGFTKVPGSEIINRIGITSFNMIIEF